MTVKKRRSGHSGFLKYVDSLFVREGTKVSHSPCVLRLDSLENTGTTRLIGNILNKHNLNSIFVMFWQLNQLAANLFLIKIFSVLVLTIDGLSPTVHETSMVPIQLVKEDTQRRYNPH